MAIKNKERRKTICSIIRAYLIFNHKATSRQLYDFINFSGFNLGSGVNVDEISKIINSSIRRKGMLEDVKIKKNGTSNVYILNEVR